MNRIKQIIFIGVSFSIVIFLIYLFFGGNIEPGENFFSINRFLFWFLGYIVCFVIGICFRFYEDGNELTEKEKKEIKSWKKVNLKNNTSFDDRITLADKTIYKWGHPFDVSEWDFEKGFVNWLLIVPFMGFGVLTVGALILGIPLAVIVVLVNILN